MILGTHDPNTGVVSEDTWSSIAAGVEVLSSSTAAAHACAGDHGKSAPLPAEMSMHVVFGGQLSLKACENVAHEGWKRVTLSDHLESMLHGVAWTRKTLAVTDDRLTHGLAEAYAPCLAGLHAKYRYDYILSADTSHARNIFPRLGAMLDIEPVHGIVRVGGDGSTFVRSMYAGNIISTVQVPLHTTRILTCRPGILGHVQNQRSQEQREGGTEMRAEEETGTPGQLWSTELTHMDSVSNDLLGGAPLHLPATYLSSTEEGPAASKSLPHASIVVAGGRAFRTKEEFEKLEAFASKIGAAVGATRALVDAGIAPNDIQIGQTGKIIAPDLYMAFGISGALQHVAGIKDSRRIVAINSDAEAPIFSAADYGMVADVHEVLDRLLEEPTCNISTRT